LIHIDGAGNIRQNANKMHNAKCKKPTKQKKNIKSQVLGITEKSSNQFFETLMTFSVAFDMSSQKPV